MRLAHALVLAACFASCAEPRSPPVAAKASQDDADARSPQTDAGRPEDAATATIHDAAATPPPPACASNDIDFAKTTHDCSGALPPAATSDLDVALSGSSTTAPDANVVFTLRITNTSGRAVAINMVRPAADDLVVVDATGAPVKPPPGTPNVTYDKRCAMVDCAAPDIDAMRARAKFVLAAGGVAHAEVAWKAERIAWPKSTVTIGCCSSSTTSPVRIGPLPIGSYAASLTVRIVGTATVWTPTTPIAVKR